MSLRILLADDHKIVRDGLRALLEKQSGLAVVAEAQDGRTTVRLARELAPDVIIMDISMPDLNGIEATRQIRTELPRIKVIALSMHSDQRFVTEVLKAGACGYLLKDCAFEELTTAIRTVMANQIYLSPQITGVVLDHYLRQALQTEVSAFSVLTEREREVLQLLAEGQSTKEIASSLHVSVKTIETHRQRIMEKLHRHSLAELIKYAIREGLTSLEP
ncbi:MAG: response regulator transcription factor [Acidobacteria bacterium]|nr:response regulator transcription factor [Acidobacteriota bacterium]